MLLVHCPWFLRKGTIRMSDLINEFVSTFAEPKIGVILFASNAELDQFRYNNKPPAGVYYSSTRREYVWENGNRLRLVLKTDIGKLRGLRTTFAADFESNRLSLGEHVL